MGLTPLLSPHGHHPEALSSVGGSACLDGGRDHRESDRVHPRVFLTGMTVSPASATTTHTWGRVRHVVSSSALRMELASDVEGLRLFLVTALGDRYEVRVARRERHRAGGGEMHPGGVSMDKGSGSR